MQLGVGEVVRIFGLTSDKGRELNGREATVLTVGDRCHVELAGGDAVSVRNCNLVRAGEYDSDDGWNVGRVAKRQRTEPGSASSSGSSSTALAASSAAPSPAGVSEEGAVWLVLSSYSFPEGCACVANAPIAAAFRSLEKFEVSVQCDDDASEERHFNSEALLYSRAAAVAAGVPFPLSQWMPLGKSGFVARAAASLPFFGPFRALQAHVSAAPILLLSTIGTRLQPRPALSGAIHLDPSRVHLGLCRRRTRSSPRAAARRWPSSRSAGGRAHRLAQRRECEQRLFTALAVNSPPTGSDNALRLKNEAGRSMASAPEKRQLGKVFGLGAKTAIDLVEAAVSVFTAAGCPPLLRLGVTDTAHDAPRLPAGCWSYHASAPTVGRPSHSPLRVASTASRPSAPCRACCSRRSTSRSLAATSGRARGPRCGRRRSAHSQRHALVALVPV